MTPRHIILHCCQVILTLTPLWIFTTISQSCDAGLISIFLLPDYCICLSKLSDCPLHSTYFHSGVRTSIVCFPNLNQRAELNSIRSQDRNRTCMCEPNFLIGVPELWLSHLPPLAFTNFATWLFFDKFGWLSNTATWRHLSWCHGLRCYFYVYRPLHIFTVVQFILIHHPLLNPIGCVYEFCSQDRIRTCYHPCGICLMKLPAFNPGGAYNLIMLLWPSVTFPSMSY